MLFSTEDNKSWRELPFEIELVQGRTQHKVDIIGDNMNWNALTLSDRTSPKWKTLWSGQHRRQGNLKSTDLLDQDSARVEDNNELDKLVKVEEAWITSMIWTR